MIIHFITSYYIIIHYNTSQYIILIYHFYLINITLHYTSKQISESTHVQLMNISFIIPRQFYSNVSKLGRADRGLYAGKSLSYGNTISEFGNRNRRTWKPNIQPASLHSSLLQERIKLKVSTEALRLIDRAGGLDSYILGQKIPESTCAKKLKERLLMRKLEIEKNNE